MKKYISSAFMLAIVSVGIISCSEKEMTVPTSEPQPLFTELTVEMPTTRTTYTDNGVSGMDCAWQAGDKLSLFAINSEGDMPIAGSKAEFTAQSAGNASVFTGTYTYSNPNVSKYFCVYPPIDVEEETKWYSTHKVLNDLFGSNCLNMNLGKCYQTSNASTDHLKYTDFMIGEFTVEDGKANVTMQRQTAVLKLVLTNANKYLCLTKLPSELYVLDFVRLNYDDPNGETGYNEVTNDEKIFTMSNLCYRFFSPYGMSTSSHSNSINIDFETPFNPDDDTYTIYVPVVPFEMKSGKALTISLGFVYGNDVEFAVYDGEITLAQNLSVEAGKIYTISKTLICNNNNFEK